VVNRAAPDPCTLVLFGGTGDLARRKLFPALYGLAREQLLPEGLWVVAASREPISTERFRAAVRDALSRFARSQPVDERTWAQLAARIEHVHVDDDGYEALRQRIEAIERGGTTGGNRLFYLATPASAFEPILGRLREQRLLRETKQSWCRVVIEKPFGNNLESACRLNRLIAEMLDERQVFRVDHYLAKETVQNILVLRFSNTVFEPLWNRKYIDHVQITAAESIGVDGRGRFYDETGVLSDVVQNHLLQVLTLCAAEPPLSFAAHDVHDRKAEVLRALRPIPPAQVAERVVAAQYRGYRDEPGVAPGSRTPTYVALELFIDNWRWQGVPFYLRAGKRLRATRTEVAIQFQSVPLCLFPPDDCRELRPNTLTLRIQPDAGIDLAFMSKMPGEVPSLAEVSMDFAYAYRFGRAPRDAYERLLLDGMRGDAMLFARNDAVEGAWEVVTPILEAWKAATAPLAVYEPGSDGPPEADALLARTLRRWRAL
jgi:glucose-6-phosphate 1-dehydrogenase